MNRAVVVVFVLFHSLCVGCDTDGLSPSETGNVNGDSSGHSISDRGGAPITCNICDPTVARQLIAAALKEYELVLFAEDRCTALIDIARAQLAAKEPSEARKTLDLAKLLVSTLDTDHKKRFYHEIATAHIEMKDILVAEEIVGLMDDTCDRVRAYCDIANVLSSAGDLSGARSTLKLAQEAAKNVSGTETRAGLLRRIAIAWARAGEYDNAAATMAEVKAMVTSERFDYYNSRIIYDVSDDWRDLIEDAYAAIEFQRAVAQGRIGQLAEGKATAAEIGDPKHRASAYCQLAKIAAEGGRMEETHPMLKVAAETAVKIEDASEQAAVYREIAEALANLGDRAGSHRILDIARATDFKRSTEEQRAWACCGSLCKTAVAQVRLGDEGGALQTLKAARELVGKISYDSKDLEHKGKALALCDVSIVQWETGDADGARESLGVAKTMAQQIEYYNVKLSIYCEIAKSQAKIGETVEACQTIETIKKIMSRIKEESASVPGLDSETERDRELDEGYREVTAAHASITSDAAIDFVNRVTEDPRKKCGWLSAAARQVCDEQ